MGNWGAGLTTADSPMLISLSLRTAPETLGAGATTAAWLVTVAAPLLEETPSTSGAGATAEACNAPAPRAVGSDASAGGATSQASAVGPLRCEPPVAASGIMGAGAWEPD